LDDGSTSEASDDEIGPGMCKNITDLVLNLHKSVTDSKIYNFKGVRTPLPLNGMNYDHFEEKLANYHDTELCKFVKYGWPIGYDGAKTNCKAKRNHNGAREFPGQVDAYIKSEISLGRMIGPFSKNPYTINIAVSPLNSLEKKGTSDRRVITDLSFPERLSVNSGISKDFYLGEFIQTKYPTVDNVISLILEKGPGCMLFKRDMNKAFRQIRVDPGDIHLLSFKWKGQIYSDTVLAMGLRSAAYICQRLTNSVAYICKKDGFEIVNYLDDFCGVEKREDATRAYSYLGSLLDYLGIEENKNKASVPSTKSAFLGIWFDTIKMTMEVTPDRLVEINELAVTWLDKKFATVKEVQSIIGKLNFVAKCDKPARLFICRMLNFLRSMPKKGQTKVPIEFSDDIRWWLKFLPKFNGISIISLETWSKPDELIASDACLVGCGAVCGKEYFHKVFPETVSAQSLHINALELLSLVIAIKIWAVKLKGKKVTVLCDNEATVWVINTGKTRDIHMQCYLRELCYLSAINEFQLYAKHIPGVDNRIPDMLSRWSISEELKECFINNELENFDTRVTVRDELFDIVSHW